MFKCKTMVKLTSSCVKDKENKSNFILEAGCTIQKDLLLIPCCFFLNVLCFGFTARLGVLYSELTSQFETPHAELAMVQGLAMGLIGFAIIWIYPVNKYGLMQCAICASILCPLSIIISSFSSSAVIIICFLGGLNGISSALLNSLSFITMNKYVPSERNQLIAFTSIGGAIGQILFSLLLVSLIRFYGWRGAILVCGGIICHIIPFTMMLYFRTKALQHQTENGASADKLWKTFLFKDWKFVVVCFNVFIFAFSILTPTRLLVGFTLEKGFDMASGAVLLSAIGISNTCARIVSVCLQIYVSECSFLLLSIFTFIGGISQFIITPTNDYFLILIGSIISGLSLGLSASQITICVLEIYPAEHFATGTVMVLVWYGAGSIISGLIGGELEYITGTYAPVFQIGYGFCILSSFLYLLVHFDIKHQRKKLGYIEM